MNFGSVDGQRRPRSACANAQADLGLRCPYIFSQNLAYLLLHFCHAKLLVMQFKQETLLPVFKFPPVIGNLIFSVVIIFLAI